MNKKWKKEAIDRLRRKIEEAECNIINLRHEIYCIEEEVM